MICFIFVFLSFGSHRVLHVLVHSLPTRRSSDLLLCRNVTAHNVVWEKWVQWASQLGLTIGAQIEAPVPGGRYRRRGPIAFGYDHLGHGEDPNSSKSALVVIEQLDNFDVVLFAYT